VNNIALAPNMIIQVQTPSMIVENISSELMITLVDSYSNDSKSSLRAGISRD